MERLTKSWDPQDSPRILRTVFVPLNPRPELLNNRLVNIVLLI